MTAKSAAKALIALFWGGIGTASALPPDQAPPAASTPVAALLESTPRLAIANGQVTAVIYPPGPGSFYGGTRFDHAGVVGSLVAGGQQFHGPWFDRTAPDVKDYAYTADGIVAGPDSAIMGPVQEFAPVGFDAAAPGALFLKLGVGLLRRPDVAPYDHYRLYEIANPGTWTVSQTADSVTMIQAVTDPALGYVYEKTLRLVPGTAQMVISHVLRNTGTGLIDTSVYDHNFLNLSPGNENLAISQPFPITDKVPKPLKADGTRMLFAAPVTGEDHASFLFADSGAPPSAYALRVDNLQTGAGVAIAGDAPMTRLNMWSIRSVMGIEPYIAIHVPPGGEQRWTYTYTYTGPR